MAADHFTDEDTKKLTELLNFVMNNGRWHVRSAQAFEFGKVYANAVSLVKKIEAHVFEVKNTINNQPPKDESAKPIKAK